MSEQPDRHYDEERDSLLATGAFRVRELPPITAWWGLSKVVDGRGISHYRWGWRWLGVSWGVYPNGWMGHARIAWFQINTFTGVKYGFRRRSILGGPSLHLGRVSLTIKRPAAWSGEI